MLEGKKYIVNYNMLLGLYNILDEKEKKLMRVKRNILNTHFIFYSADKKELIFQLREQALKFGILKGSVVYDIIDERGEIVGHLDYEESILAMFGKCTCLITDKSNQKIGTFIFAGDSYNYILKDQVVGKLFKATKWGSNYIIDLSLADSSIDRRIPLSLSILTINNELWHGAVPYAKEKTAKV